MVIPFTKIVFEGFTEDHNMQYLMWYSRVPKDVRIGYVGGTIRHYYHGNKLNRKYMNRHKILQKYNYSPSSHMTYNADGIIVPTDDCPKELLTDILNYFEERHEDE